MKYTRTQTAIQRLAAFILFAAGLGHLVAIDTLARFIPPYLPAPQALVILSGVAELAGAAGLLLARFRRPAAWGLSAMLICFLPANVYMTFHPADAGLAQVPVIAFYARLALLPVMIWGLFWCTRPAPPPAS